MLIDNNISLYTHIAAASILAGVAVTFIGFQLTVDASEARPASACVAALACVGTGRSIGTRLVVGAVVEVLVTEETSPTLLTVTLPWLAAHPMKAARVTYAFIAEGALPAHPACTAPRGFTVTMLRTAG